MAKKNTKKARSASKGSEKPNFATNDMQFGDERSEADVTSDNPSSSSVQMDTSGKRGSKRARSVVSASKSAAASPDVKKSNTDPDWKGAAGNKKVDAELEKIALAIGPTRRSTRVRRTAETAAAREPSNGNGSAKKTTKKENRTDNSAKKGRAKKAETEVDPESYRNLVAKLPPCRSGVAADEGDRDQVIWSAPTENFFENPDNTKTVCQFVRNVNDSSGIGIDRALYNLQLCNYNIDDAEKAIDEMKTCRRVPWSEDEADLFRRGFAAYGKNFPKIHEIIPHKSLREIIAYYYESKPYEQYKASASNIGPDEVDFGDSDDEGAVRRGNCLICTKDRNLYNLANGMVCKACKVYKNMMEDFDEDLTEYDYFDVPPARVINCPDRMAEIVNDIITKNASDPVSLSDFEDLKTKELEKVKARASELASEGSPEFDDILLKKPPNLGFYFLTFDRRPTKCQTESRLIKERVSTTIKRCEKLEADIETDFANLQLTLQEVEKAKILYSDTRPPRSRNTPDWALDEKKMAMSAMVRFGLDFKAASAIVRTKSPDMVEIFYKKHKNRLDPVINKHRQALKKEVEDVTAKFFSTL